jgi:enoyl-CoA hydratase/carnithine racemase
MSAEQEASRLPPYESIRIEREAGVGVVVIDRPPRNALIPTTMLEIRDAMYRLDEDPAIGAAILTGAGKYFCSGADLTRRDMLKADGMVDRGRIRALREEHRERLGLKGRDLPQMRIPVIAAINGSAAGGGLTLALAADIRIVAEDAILNMAFVQRGIGPEHGITWLLPRMLGQSLALELLLSGRRLDGAEAARIGLASRSLPAAEVLPAAMELARGIVERCSPLSVAMMKQLTWAHMAEPSYVSATRNEQASVEWITQQADVNEGIKAFMEKRQPRWQTTGREAKPSYIATLFETAVEEF